jgi:hypothetical protein
VGSRSLYGKTRNDLWFAVVRELKVFFFQIRDHFAVGVADHDAHEDQVDTHLESRWRIVRNDFVVGGLRAWFVGVLGCVRRWGLSSLRSCGRSLGASGWQSDEKKNATEKS